MPDDFPCSISTSAFRSRLRICSSVSVPLLIRFKLEQVLEDTRMIKNLYKLLTYLERRRVSSSFIEGGQIKMRIASRELALTDLAPWTSMSRMHLCKPKWNRKIKPISFLEKQWACRCKYFDQFELFPFRKDSLYGFWRHSSKEIQIHYHFLIDPVPKYHCIAMNTLHNADTIGIHNYL